jgi:replication factor C small subunit
MENINRRLDEFIRTRNIPNIIFHGHCMKTNTLIIDKFIQKLYPSKESIQNYVMRVNCGHCKGIKFIREDLKFFSKTHINNNGGLFFKSVVLLNADKLTIDAQSALRRCIEIFSHTTRFFVLVEDKYKLLKPILSRFCEIPIHIEQPVASHVDKFVESRITYLNKTLNKYITDESVNHMSLIELSEKLYSKAYSGLDILKVLENETFLKISLEKRYELLFTLSKIKKEIRKETMYIYIILHMLFIEIKNDTLCDSIIQSVI